MKTYFSDQSVKLISKTEIYVPTENIFLRVCVCLVEVLRIRWKKAQVRNSKHGLRTLARPCQNKVVKKEETFASFENTTFEQGSHLAIFETVSQKIKRLAIGSSDGVEENNTI